MTALGLVVFVVCGGGSCHTHLEYMSALTGTCSHIRTGKNYILVMPQALPYWMLTTEHDEKRTPVRMAR